MDTPYLHLNIPFRVRDSWKNLVTDFNSKQYIRVFPPDYLEQETLDFFNSVGLNPYYANIWSWPNAMPSIWHVDQSKMGEPTVAFNFLLMGDSGITEWIDFSKVRCIDSDGQDPTYGTKDVRFIGSSVPDFASSIKPNHVMMIRNDIPHRVNRLGQKNIRWTIRVSLKRKNSDEALSWDEAVNILKDYKLAE